jgi:hypothetical protein
VIGIKIELYVDIYIYIYIYIYILPSPFALCCGLPLGLLPAIGGVVSAE